MVCTSSDSPPPLDSFNCVPRRWCKPATAPPKLVWSDAGTGGRNGSLWQVGAFGLLIVQHGHAPPAGDQILELTAHRFLLAGGNTKLWLPPELSTQHPPTPNSQLQAQA